LAGIKGLLARATQNREGRIWRNFSAIVNRPSPADRRTTLREGDFSLMWIASGLPALRTQLVNAAVTVDLQHKCSDP